MKDEFQLFVPRVIDDDVSAEQAPAEPVEPAADKAYQSWLPPEVSLAKPQAARPRSADSVTSADTSNNFEELQKQAYDKAFQQGLEDGKRETTRLLAEQTQHLQSAIAALREPLKWMDEELERELFQLTLTLSRQLLRHELDLRPELIESLVHNAIAALPAASGSLEIDLHPDDAQLIRSHCAERDESLDPLWHIKEDPTLSRGGCRISSNTSHIDEQIETRLQRLKAEMLGEQAQPHQIGANDTE
jgi:flagellar assembly protein FliH